MNTLSQRAVGFLEEVYDPRVALFPYSTRVINDRYASDYRHPSAVRYTINCLLALRTAEEREPGGHPFTARADDLVAEFLDRNEAKVTNDGDRGLLLALLAGRDGEEGRAAERLLTQSIELERRGGNGSLTLQDVSWLLWGVVAADRAGDRRAAPIARALFRRLVGPFFDRDSLFPRQSLRRYRRSTVSFGGLVYFLRALHEYATSTGDEYAETLFRHGVSRVLATQCPGGEWPWFYSVRAGRPIDVYPVYSVHQDSMAMLFLLPALDRGLSGASDAINRSYGWVLGRNQIGQSMIRLDPFLRYRSIERRGPLQRPRRYARSLLTPRGRGSVAGKPELVQVNQECRSYEMGWIVFAWAGRQEVLGMAAGERAVTFQEEPAGSLR